MATEGALQYIPGIKSSADLSAKQFRVMKVSGAGTVTVTAAITDKPVGILQDNPASGLAASVAFAGVSKAIAGAAVSAGDEVGTDNQGRIITITPGTDTTAYRVGRALTAASNAGEYLTILISLGGRAA